MNVVIFLFNLYYTRVICTFTSKNSMSGCPFDSCRLGFEDVVKYLLETHKASVDVRDGSNKTAIFHAVTSSQTTVLKYLLSLVSRAVSQKIRVKKPFFLKPNPVLFWGFMGFWGFIVFFGQAGKNR